MNKQYDYNWRKIRMTILQRDGFICAYCGQQADTVDHITPLAKGGTNDPDNLTAACNRCNATKKDSTAFFLRQSPPIDTPPNLSLAPQIMTRIKPVGAFSSVLDGA
jgi:5-methylcytosine-specific restriction endonuclease McrA